MYRAIGQPAPQSSPGFSLVEVLVAISLLLLALVGPMTFMTRSSASSEIATQQAVATFLAQEGIEVTQQVRDEEFLRWFNDSSHQAWTEFTNQISACMDPNGCRFDRNASYNPANPASRPWDFGFCGTTCTMRFNNQSDPKEFQYGNPNTLGFIGPTYTRIIRVEELSPDEYRIESTVTWRSGAVVGEQQVQVDTSVFNIFNTD